MTRRRLRKHLRRLRFGPKAVAVAQLAILALFLALFFWWLDPKSETDTVYVDQATTTRAALFPPLEIEARSAYIYDVREKKVLYGKDAELQLPLASLTKLMSAYAVSTLIPDHVLIEISSQDLLEEGDTGLHPGEIWRLRDLIDYTLITSSNDGARALASAAGSEISTSTDAAPVELFVRKMNEIANELGLRETYFLNQSGLDINPGLSGGYGSAQDVALLMARMLERDPRILEGTTYRKTTISSKQFWHHAENTNKAIVGIPNALGSKTGFTDLSGGNVAVAWNAGLDRPIIAVVLGSSYEGRFKDLSILVEATSAYLKETASPTKTAQ